MRILAYVIFCLVTLAFCCMWAYQPSEGISGDWRRWGFESDPLAPEPQPTDELELV